MFLNSNENKKFITGDVLEVGHVPVGDEKRRTSKKVKVNANADSVFRSQTQLHIHISGYGFTPIEYSKTREVPHKIYNDIKKYRQMFDLDQTELAFLMGISKATLEKAEQKYAGLSSHDIFMRAHCFVQLGKYLESTIKVGYLRRQLFHNRISSLGDKSLFEFSSHMKSDTRIYEVSSLIKKILG